MIFTEEKLNALDEERINDNIDREDVIRFITTYSLQDKVSVEENQLISSFCRELINREQDPNPDTEEETMTRERSKRMIENSRERRTSAGEAPTMCMFQFTTPECKYRSELEDDENIKIITNMLHKYNVRYDRVDTVGCDFNLNRDWIETDDIPCFIEYCGVYPVNWDIEDIITMEHMIYAGKIMTKVLWHTEDGKYVPNN